MTNPDGSTTTTTTTPTDTTTTTTEETEISGSTEGSEEVDTSTGSGQEEAGSVEEDIKDALGEAETEKNVFDWNRFEETIKNIHPDAQVSDNADGSRTHTVTFTTPNSESRPDHLSANELGILLGVTVSQNEDGGYFYTREDGTVVNLAVEDRSETTSNAIRWTVTVQETYAVESGSENVGGSTITPDTPPETPSETPTTDESAADVLNKVTTTGDAVGDPDERGNQTYHGTYGETEATVTKDTGGNIVKVVVGTKTYEFTYTSGDTGTVHPGDLTDDQIRALLPEEQGYTVANHVILKDGYELTIDESITLLQSTSTHIGMTVTDSTLGSSEEVPGDPTGAQWAAEKNAVVDAVLKAIKGDSISRDDVTVQSVQEQLDKDTDGDHSWEVTIKAGDKTYTYTVTSMAANQTTEHAWYATKIDVKQDELNPDGTITAGKDTTYTGGAYISGETIFWTEKKDGDAFHLNADGKVDLKPGVSQLYGDVVTGVTENADGTTTVITQNGDVSKTYVFSYNQELTDEEKEALLAHNQKGDFTNLKKITWTVTTETSTTSTPDFVYVASDDGVTVQWQDDGATATITTADGTEISVHVREDGTYTGVDGAVYTIERNESLMSDQEIFKLLMEHYGLTNATGIRLYNEGTHSIAIFRDAEGNQIALTYKEPKKVSYTITMSEQSVLVEGMLNSLKEQLMAELDRDSTAKFYIDGNEVRLSGTGSLCVIDKNTNNMLVGSSLTNWLMKYNAVDFANLGHDALTQYLQALQNRGGSMGESSSFSGVELVTGSQLDVVGTDRTYTDCVIVGGADDKLHFEWVNADGSSNGDSSSFEVSPVYNADDRSYTYHFDTAGNTGSLYKLSGKVAYDAESGYFTATGADVELKALREQGYVNAVKVKVLQGVGETYRIYKQVVDFVTYGNAGQNLNDNTLNLKLNLKLFENGCAAGFKGTDPYLVTLEKRTGSSGTHADLGTSTFTKTETVSTTDATGRDYFGSYDITETPDVRHPVGTHYAYNYTGHGTAINESYTLWHPLGAQTGLGAVRTDYSGTLGYTYLRPDTPNVTIRGEKDLHRNINATVTSTSVTTRPGAPIIDTVTRPAPVVPDVPDVPVVPETPVAPIAPTTPADETDRAPSAATPATATDIGDTQTPQAETPASTPAQPQLANLPDAQTPTAQAPVNTVSEIADSVVPLAESIDSGFTLLDASVPLSDIPNTGDGFQSGALGGILAAAGLGLIALRKKDESEE